MSFLLRQEEGMTYHTGRHNEGEEKDIRSGK